MEAAIDFALSILPYLSRFNAYLWAVLGFVLVLYIFVFILGILLWRLTFGKVLVFIACLIPFAAPFGLEYTSTKVLWPLDINLSGRNLSYSPTFFIDGTITPTGKLPIKGCIITTTLNPPAKSLRSKLIALLKPKLVDKLTLDGPFVLGEPYFIQNAIRDISTEMVAKFDVACY